MKMERIVSRADLAGNESAASTSVSPQPEEIENTRNLSDLEFVYQHKKIEGNEFPDAEADEELDFRLFAAPKTGSQAAIDPGQKIRLRSPSIDPANAGFVQPRRPESYYFAAPPTGKQERELEAVALTGNEMVALSQTYRPGCSYSWKVLHLPPSGLSKELQLDIPSGLSRLVGDADSKKRTRPGKKYRIKIRKKLAAKSAAADARKAAAEAKEIAEQEKRTRRNREKKVKKKAKEKAKKVGETNDENVVLDPPATPTD